MQTFKLRQGWMLLVAGATMGLVFVAPSQSEAALQAGLRLCVGPLLVSLFPFLIVSSLIMQSGAGETLGFAFRPVVRLIGLRAPAAGGVLLVGMLGGFAPAALAAKQAVRAGTLTPAEASALLPACICFSPSFVVLTVGEAMLGSRALGVQLFVSQLLAGYLTAALLHRINGAKSMADTSSACVAEEKTETSLRLDQVIAQAAVTYGKLCGFVLYFRFLSQGLGLLVPEEWRFVPALFLEVSSGCDLASETGLWASGLCCAALSVQGVSVLMQVRTICPREISFKPLLAGRVIHLPLSLALFYLGLPEQAVETFGNLQGKVIPMRRVPLDCALLVFFVCCFTACELCCMGQRKETAEEM